MGEETNLSGFPVFERQALYTRRERSFLLFFFSRSEKRLRYPASENVFLFGRTHRGGEAF